MPDISVIIPAYNRAGLIGETLQSLLNQTLPAREIIVVDDGSTDDTARVVERIAEELEVRRLEIDDKQGAGSSDQGALDSRHSPLDSQPAAKPRLRVIRQQNAGPGVARNRGLAEATGEFIHFFDSDDVAAPNKHEVQLRALIETGADIAYGPWVKGRFVENELPRTDCGELIAERRVAPKIDGTTDDTDKHGFGNHQRHELTRKEEAGQRLARQAGAAFSNPSTSELARDSENTSPIRSADGPAEALDARLSTLDSDPGNFVPEGPVFQARGLPHGDLVRALLTNWSIVPHACLFRRSILEKAGGFPEDIWVGEDQLLFLRCLLAGAKVVHSPETMVFYRLGDDTGKLTATGAPQKRHARDWAKFLVKANEEVSSAGKRVPAEAQRRGDFLTTIERQGGREKEQPQAGPKGEGVGMSESNYTDKHGYQKNQNGNAQGTCAGAAFSNPCTSELARDSENTSLTRCASGSSEEALRADYMGSGSAGGNQLADSNEFLEGQSKAGLQMDNQKDPTIRTANDPSASREYSSSVLIRDIRGSNSATLDSSTPPAEWYGFRFRAYEAWRDLEKFFPTEENELKENLERIFLQKRKFRKTETLKYQAAGFLLRKLGGLKLRVLGFREHASFRCGKYSSFIDFGE
jgi:GT2 family glycosyltransferase